MIAQILMDVQPVKIDRQWFVDVTMNGRKVKQRGPFADEAAAKIAADELIKHWSNPATPATTSDGAVILNGKLVELTSDLGRKFVIACTRSAEGVIKDSDVIDEFEISIAEWEAIKTNTKLGRAIREEGRRRVANGQRAREAAQQHFTKAPKILDEIMSGEKHSPRHRIEAAREIRAVATGSGDESSPANAAERFIITFNLGSDTERIEKVIEPKPKQIEGELNVDE
jgi:hypothetical protein